MAGDKILVLDDQLVGPLGLVAPSTFLKENGVKKIFKLTDKPFDTDLKNVIYIVRPRMHLMKWIGNQVSHFKKAGKNISVFLVPRKTLICERILEEIGIVGDIKVGEFALDLIPMDDDILSMEIPSSFKECNLDGDLSSLYYVARSIMKLQSFYGLIPHIKVKGENARNVYDMVLRMRKQVGSEVFNAAPEINTLILIDRKVDLITPMVTQHTYEGLIDELFGIKHNIFQPQFQCVPDVPPSSNPKVLLNSNDNIYSRIRDLNQQLVGRSLNKSALEIDKKTQAKKDLKTVQQIKEFTEKLPMLQEDKKNLEIHIKIAEHINHLIGKSSFRKYVQAQLEALGGDDERTVTSYIEEMIDKQEPLIKVLRLLCLQSVTQNGLKKVNFENFRRDIVQSYGIESLLILNNLDKCGLIKKQGEGNRKYSWRNFSTGLFLYKEDTMELPDDKSRTDIHAVHSGYAPLSVTLVERAMAEDGKGWNLIADLLEHLPGDRVEVVQKGAMDTQPGKKVVLVYYIGGITFAELSALRYLNEVSQHCEYIVATTKLINGDTFLETLIEDVDNSSRFKKRAVSGLSLIQSISVQDDRNVSSPGDEVKSDGGDEK
ncbi:vacuolar protein sorting protein VPS33 [Acrasis kona]|uniref:Vacuolar protein sorting protein VPS33 n=1 Tax=Acrasis kona TaxID=1008807 RepID=A0AAW2YUM9_9EUKA